MNSCSLMIFNKYNNFQSANVFIQLLLLHVYPYILLTNKKFNLIGLRSSMVDRSISSTIIFFRPVHHSKLIFHNQSLHNGHSKRALVVNFITKELLTGIWATYNLLDLRRHKCCTWPSALGNICVFRSKKSYVALIPSQYIYLYNILFEVNTMIMLLNK